MSNHNPQSLITLAEKAAEASMDPAKYDFLTALEAPGGIKMPTDKVIVFLDADVAGKMVKLEQERNAIIRGLTASDESDTKVARDGVFAQLVNEQEKERVDYDKAVKAAVASRAAYDQENGEDMVGGITDEDEERPALPQHAPFLSMVELQQKVVALVPDKHSPFPDRIEEIGTLIEELTHLAWAARYEIEIEGIQPIIQQEYEDEIAAELLKPLQKDLDPEQKQEYQNERRANELVSRSITAVFDARKNTRSDFSEERMPAVAARRLIRVLPTSETTKLIAACQVLTYAAVLIDLKSDAGFPGGRTEPEGEQPLGAGTEDGQGVG